MQLAGSMCEAGRTRGKRASRSVAVAFAAERGIHRGRGGSIRLRFLAAIRKPEFFPGSLLL